MLLNNLYYHLRPIIPRRIQIALRRRFASQKREYYSSIWPIDRNAGVAPAGFNGWQDKKRFALVLTHDVETRQGHDKCRQLTEMELKLGFRSAFNFVPKRYDVSKELRRYLKENDFEVGVHGLYHDGKLYKSRSIFVERSVEINRFIKEWNAVGFRSPSMHKNLKWIHDLDIEYDSSTFDTDPFEPHSDGVGLIFPFLVSDEPTGRNYIELPYTMPQDSTLFIIMEEKCTDIWKKKLDWIVEKGGMAYMTTHPDYMNFGGGRCATDEYPADYYSEFLNYIKEKYAGQYWQALPREVAEYWSLATNGTSAKEKKKNPKLLLSDNRIEQVAAIHKSELEDSGFLSECSVKAISLFYKSVIPNDSTIFFVDKDPDDEIRGFIFCTTDRNGYFNKFMKENKLQLMLYPSVFLPLLKAMRRKTRKDQSQNQEGLDYDCEIVYMAVKREYQRQGIAKRLVKMAEAEFLKRQIDRYYLQVFSDNLKAIEFYKAAGFEIIQDFSSNNGPKCLMGKGIPQTSS